MIRDGAARCKAVADVWGPDGVSPEGTHYWDFGAHRYFCLLDALETGLGTSFGLADDPLLAKCARWRVAARGPAGDFPYGDGDRRNFSALALSWRAMKTGEDWLVNTPDLRRMARDPGHLAESKLWLAQTLLWLPAGAVDGTPPDELLAFAGRGGAGGGDTSGRAVNKGDGPIAVGEAGDISNVLHREAWDPGALWLGAVGGRADVSHGHMHAGSFCLDDGLGRPSSDGGGEPVRWVTEVDAFHYDSYRREGLELWTWGADLPADRRARGRDAVYAWGARGHNTLTVDGAAHDPHALAPLIDYEAGGGATTATFDLTAVLGGTLASATRTLEAGPDGVTVTDRWTAGAAPASVTARLHTGAAVSVAPDGRSMTLAQAGRTLRVELAVTDGAGDPVAGPAFLARPAAELVADWDRAPAGVTAADVTVPTPAGAVRVVRVRLSRATGRASR